MDKDPGIVVKDDTCEIANENNWSEIRVNSKLPERRSYSAITVHNDKLYVYGGIDLNESSYGNIISISLTHSNPSWEHKIIKGALPPNICRHASVQSNGLWYISGGEVNFEATNNIFCINLLVDTSEIYNVDIPKIDSHSMVEAAGTLILFGGYQNGHKSSNVYKIEIASLKQAIKAPISQPWPCSRSNHAAAYVGNVMYIFAGLSDDDEKLNDLWKYESNSNQWTEIKFSDGPAARCSHSLVSMGENSLLLFGGQAGIGKEKNDVWCFDCNMANWKCLFENQQIKLKIKEESMNMGQCTPHQDNSKKLRSINSRIFSMLQGLKVEDASPQRTFYKTKNNSIDQGKPFSTTNTIPCAKRSSSLQHHKPKFKYLMNLDKQEVIQIRNISSPSNDLMRSSAIHGLKPSASKYSYKLNCYTQPLIGQVPNVFPCARDGHSAATFGKAMVIFGGDRNKVAFNDLFIFTT